MSFFRIESTPLVPARWAPVLTAERLAFIGGSNAAGPFLAGFELWESRGAVFSTVVGGTNQWRAVFAAGARDVWAVGTDGKMARLGDTGWAVSSFGAQTGVDVCAWGDQAWVPVTNGEIQCVQNGQWRSWKPDELAQRHTGVLWGAAADDVWMHTHRRASGVPPDLGHWDGESWSFHPLSRNGYISSIHGNGANNVWAVGWVVKWIGKGPLAAHWDGQRWSEPVLPTKNRLTDVHITQSGTVWISGLNRTLLRGDGVRFFPVEAPEGDITSVFATDDGGVWLVVDGTRVFKANVGALPSSSL